ncbi:NAD(P)/FAD-dependent oxidoreductase [Francisella sp. SYW-9]|uniref:NAD(P)/FAD-dependent oxidoreductase n=1 Tax=Francisella sp. SYW-9 TaxID=2610888 RepID=UPI00123CC2D1|nr:FAD-binding oxidoreductase [Francisella sp. SYW-9]
MINLPNDDEKCGWYKEANISNTKSIKRLEGKHNADYVVIGSGFCGVSAARQLAKHKPNAHIILIDAQRVGQAAAGRNSGFVIDLPHKFALENPDLEFKQKILKLNRLAISNLDSLIKTYDIKCQWSAAGKYQGAVGSRGEDFLNHFEKLLKELKEEYKIVERESLAKVIGTNYYSRAIYTPGTYLVQPAALIKGLADSLPENVTLLEESPIYNINKKADKWELLSSTNNSINTSNLLLTTGIFTREFGYLKNRMLPVMTFASWTPPLTQEQLISYKGQANWGLTPADHAGTTLRMTLDNRLLIRNTYRYVPKYGASLKHKFLQKVYLNHLGAIKKRYPEVPDLRLSDTWGGTYAISRNFTNFFGQFHDGAYASVCDNGVGIAWGTISGMLLADMAVGSYSEELNYIKEVTGMPALNPPGPLSHLAAEFRMSLAKWKSGSEI